MPGDLDIDAIGFSGLVAPAITRAFISGMGACREPGRPVVASFGGVVAGRLIDLRNPLAAGRRVTAVGLAALTRYDDPAEVAEQFAASVDAGLVRRDDDGSFTATERGHAFLSELWAAQATALDNHWPPQFLVPLVTLLGRAIEAAESTGGAAWQAQAPPHEPQGTSTTVLVLNRLSTLRYHRADAHAAAWQQAGVTAEQIKAAGWGSSWSPQRRAVEEETNRLAAAPYAAFEPGERLILLGQLAALP